MIGLIRKNPALAAGILLPLGLMVFFCLATFIPMMTVAPPQYRVLFTVPGDDNSLSSSYQFRLVGDKLTAKAHLRAQMHYMPGGERLYVFDPAHNSTREIIPAAEGPTEGWAPINVPELADWKISSENVAPDGYMFDGRNAEAFGLLFFYDRARNVPGLSKGGRLVPIHMPDGNTNYSPSMKFLGWIINDGDKR